LKTITHILYSTKQQCNKAIPIWAIVQCVFSIIYHTAGTAPATRGTASATAQATPAGSGMAPASAQVTPATRDTNSATAGATPATRGTASATAQATPATRGIAPLTAGMIPAVSGTVKYAYFTLQNKQQYFLQTAKMLQSIEIVTNKHFAYWPRAPS
jgi:hypothetical protein